MTKAKGRRKVEGQDRFSGKVGESAQDLRVCFRGWIKSIAKETLVVVFWSGLYPGDLLINHALMDIDKTVQ